MGSRELVVVILPVHAMLRAWFKRTCLLLDGSTTHFKGRHPFRAFYSNKDGHVYYFAPFAPRELRPGRMWSVNGLRRIFTAKGAMGIRCKDRCTLFLHEAAGHGVLGLGHHVIGMMALSLWTRIRTTTWGSVAWYWAALEDHVDTIHVVRRET